jgi:transketolase C-terminal domain/subunit
MDKEPYKNLFGKTIEALASEDKDVVYLDADLMNSIGTHGFWKKNKNQAVNCGIAEADMIGIAAGLSAGGKKPYVILLALSLRGVVTTRCFFLWLMLVTAYVFLGQTRV